jgi:SAM-dependent methyltransferase
MTTLPDPARVPWRVRVVLGLFDVLYHNTVLYWLASTIPFAGQWRTWQRLAIPRIQGRDVLEIGCGPGWLLADMLLAGYQCQAIDASSQMVQAARRTIRKRARVTVPDYLVHEGRAQDLPFGDASFDSVVSTFPTPYITDILSMREIARVLRPGGKLIIIEGANLIPRGPLLSLLVLFERFVYGRVATKDLPDPMDIARHLPLAAVGLQPAGEIVTGPFWRVFIVTAVKSSE